MTERTSIFDDFPKQTLAQDEQAKKINKYPAPDYNRLIHEIDNTLKSSGQDLLLINNNKAQSVQLQQAIKNYASSSNLYIEDAGSAVNTYIVKGNKDFATPKAYVNGMVVKFKSNYSNTGASTINVCGLGVKNVYMDFSSSTIDSDSITSGIIVELIYIEELNGFYLVRNASISTGLSFLGQIIHSILPINNDKVKLFDGSLIDQSIYGTFTTYLKSLVPTYPNLFCNESVWQASIITYGQCAKFVIDDINGKIRLPKITDYLKNVSSLNELGDVLNDGLPNITGTLGFTDDDSYAIVATATGAFKKGAHMGGTIGGNIQGTSSPQIANFDASSSSSTYGNSTAVTPRTAKICLYIVLANTVVSEISVADITQIGQQQINLIQSEGTSQKNIVSVEGNTQVARLGSIVEGSSIRTVGEIVKSDMPLSNSGLHLLDGELLLNGGSYNDFINHVASLVPTTPLLFTTEANWQSDNTNFGGCEKYVYTAGISLRLPKVYNKNRFVIKSYVNGNDWYKIYNDGWIEQGGLLAVSQTTLTFITPFVSSPSNVTFTGISSDGTTTVKQGEIGYNTISNTGLVKVAYNKSLLWQAKGYGEAPEGFDKPSYTYICVGNLIETGITININQITNDLQNKTDLDGSNAIFNSLSETAKSNIISFTQPKAINTIGVGQVLAVSTTVSTQLNAPAGGTWLFIDNLTVNETTGGVVDFVADAVYPNGSIVAGGTKVRNARSGYIIRGLFWRLA